MCIAGMLMRQCSARTHLEEKGYLLRLLLRYAMLPIITQAARNNTPTSEDRSTILDPKVTGCV